MYSITTTPGFVINSRSHNEAGKIISIFTRDLGLIHAIAQGIRLEKSKLRYFSQDYSLNIFSLVHGKEFWRLTSAQGFDLTTRNEMTDLALGGICSYDQKKLIVRIATLLHRFLHGQEINTKLFDCIQSVFSFFEQNKNITERQLITLESIIILRILHLLGYIGSHSFLDKILDSNYLSVTLLNDNQNNRTIINQHINKAFRESHL